MPSIFASSDTVMLYGGSNRPKTASLRPCENRGTAFLNPPNVVKSRWCQLSCQRGVHKRLDPSTLKQSMSVVDRGGSTREQGHRYGLFEDDRNLTVNGS